MPIKPVAPAVMKRRAEHLHKAMIFNSTAEKDFRVLLRALEAGDLVSAHLKAMEIEELMRATQRRIRFAMSADPNGVKNALRRLDRQLNALNEGDEDMLMLPHANGLVEEFDIVTGISVMRDAEGVIVSVGGVPGHTNTPEEPDEQHHGRRTGKRAAE